ncbi:MAG TPA: hypothetical protein VFO34_01230 [Candidatus Acidoferrales bacterium]|nr:hypothetical protein [Candidatus Acidoferrales bacterium]
MADAQASPLAAVKSSGSSAFKAIFLGGLLVGVIDIAYAILVYSPRHPVRILQSVGSGIFGRNSFKMGAESAIVGLLCHFTIAIGAAAVYYLASRKIPFMTEHAVIAGMIYGALVYGFMHLVVLPLSAAPAGHAAFIYKACEFVEHWFGVGLPIALSVRRYAPYDRVSSGLRYGR